MERVWTPEQLAAIDTRDRTLLVSAAAGSGKTAVLTERIIKSLCDKENPLDLTRLLVVTFTRAAATEMRTRIGRAIGDALTLDPTNQHLSRQLMLLGSARISTIDSFYLDLVRANFEEAGMSPAFRLVDEGELLSLRQEIMNRVIDRIYAEEPKFLAVAELLSSVRREDALAATLLRLSRELEKLPAKYDLLLRAADDNKALGNAPFESPYGKIVFDDLQKMAEDGMRMVEATLALIAAEPEAAYLRTKREKCLLELRELLQNAHTALLAKDIDRLTSALTLPPRLASAGSVDAEKCSPKVIEALALCQTFRDEWKARAAQLRPFTAAEIKEGSMEAAELLRLLHRVLSRYDEAYTAAKRERDVAEFGDVSRAAYRLLVAEDNTPTPLAASLAASFDAVYIDEYQDVDAMQDATFRAISTPVNRFMVGDIKQSIYRFRGAEPAVFAGYKTALPPLEGENAAQDAAAIFMSSCFRCDESIIRFVNCISGYLFENRPESIGYVADDALKFAKRTPTPDYKSPLCQVLVYHDDEKRSADDGERDGAMDDAEARMIAAEIKRLIDCERLADGRPITAGDIAVLGRSAAFAAPLARYLAELGIPANDTSRKNFFENPEVLCMYALLAVIDNPLRDVYLAAVLRSPFFGFTLEELIAVRSCADRALSLFEAMREGAEQLTDGDLRMRVRQFLEKLAIYRDKAEALPVDKLLRFLYRDTAVLAFAGDGEGDRKNRRQNLLRLYEYARTFEMGGFKGLYRFVRYVEDLMQNETEMPTPEGPDNAVSLITVHHAKGLEFPVCFVATAGKQFNTQDLTRHVLIEPSLGAATRVPNVGCFSRAGTFGREALKIRLEQLLREEEMRILYVAMTRARERLYITGKPRYSLANTEKHVAAALSPVTDRYALGGNSYLEWVLTALARTPHADFAQITYHTPRTLRTLLQEAATQEIAAEGTVNAAKREALAASFEKQFAFSYPYAHLGRLPAKLSVSRLSPTVLDVYDAEPTATLDSEDCERLLHTFERAPVFGEKQTTADAAARGTATHEFLQFCNLEGGAISAENELDRLIAARFLSPDTRDAVRIDELKLFFQSDFYKILKNARSIWRETRFNIFLPAAAFTEDEALRAQLTGEKLLVQGVIDLIVLDESQRLVLCDYKTDRLSAAALRDDRIAGEELFSRHGNQLAYYKRAVEALFGRPPDRTVIYSLPLGRALDEPTA